jgi:peptide chain release factor 1
MLERLAEIEARFEEVNRLLSDPDVISDHRRLADLGRERSQLEPTVNLIRQFRGATEALADARALVRDGDADEKELGHEEEDRLATEVERIEAELMVALLPHDPADDKDVIVEIRAGTGGEEAALFASDLFRIYTRYAERQGWKAEVINTSDASAGGYKEITFELHGAGAYSRMKYESGVHRVQRVPETESQGRIHTSTATVAVLPEVDDIETDIDWNEVRIDIFHSGGAGGQNVNKVATAVRFTHEPSGIVVVMQDERSQAKNRVKAETVLRARLYQMEREKADAELADARRAQVGTGTRSEKIRTYNFPQDRITDHRVGMTTHGMSRIFAGEIDELIDAVALDEQSRLLQATTD